MNDTSGAIQDFDWMLSCSRDFDATLEFVRDVLGLEIGDHGSPRHDTQFSRYACARLPSGRTLEIVEAADPDSPLRGRQILCLASTNLAAARQDLARRGAVFLGDLVAGEDGIGWVYLRAPDGNVYQVYGPLPPESS